MPPRRSPHPFTLFVFNQDQAAQIAEELLKKDQVATAGVIRAMLAIAHVGRHQLLELRKIRRALEAHNSNLTAALNPRARLVPKEGTATMALAPLTPTETQDVEVTLDPRNAAGQPTTGPFSWSLSNNAAGELKIATDMKSARLVTAPGDIDCVISFGDPRTGVLDTVGVSRVGPPPFDNNTVVLNATAQVVDKLPV